MWHLNRLYARNRIESLSTVNELTYNATRNLMFAATLFFSTGVLITSGFASTFVINVLFAVLGILLLLSVITYRLMERFYLVSQVVWQIGLVGALMATIWATRARPKSLR